MKESTRTSQKFAGLLVFLCIAVSGHSALKANDNIPIISTDLTTPALLTVAKKGDTVTVRSQLHSPAADFVYTRNRTGRLTEIANEVTVEYVDGALPKGSRLQSIRTAAEVETTTAIFGKRHRLQVRTNAKEAIAALNQRMDVRYAYPVLYDLSSLHRIILTDRIVVCLASPDVTIETINKRYGTETVSPLTDNQWVVRLVEPKKDYPLDVSEAIAADPAVAWAEPDFIQERDLSTAPNDTFFGNQWHLHSTGQNIGGKTPTTDNDVDAPEAWDITTGSSDVVIAIVDTGVQTDHPDLSANIHPNGYDFYDNDSDPNPSHADDNHGTACAGVAAAIGNNNLGVAGAAYGCKILPVKISEGGYFASDLAIANAIRYAAQYADVISCSWGGGLPSTTIRTAIRDARQDGVGGKGSIVLFASANSGGFRGFELSGLSATTYTFKWKFTKNSSVSEGEDTCWLDSVTFPDGVTENFDSVTPPALPSGWSGSWTSMNSDSVHPAHSGSIFAKANSISHSQTTYLTRTRTLSSGGSLIYYMRVNCEDNSASYWQDYGAIEISGSTYLRTAGTVAYPSARDSCVCVGACNSDATKSDYSQYGPGLDFVTPSSGNSAQLRIESTDRTGSDGYNTSAGTAGDYCKAGDSTGFGGTSSSTPLAAGIAALVRSVIPNLSPAQIRNIMRDTADKIDSSSVSYSGRQNGRNDFYGWGRVNACAAVQKAQTCSDILSLGNDLKITEVSDTPDSLEFIEIYNKSATTAYSLNNLALTDNEAGNDTGEGTCRFPEGNTIPSQGMVVIIVGTSATQAFVDEITANASGPDGPAGGVQVFETADSGLSFNGSSIPEMEVLGTAAPGLYSSDNVMLVVTDGKEITFLSEVIDGVVYGSPSLSSGCDFGVAPRLAETATYADTTGLDDGYSLQRIPHDADSNDSSQDFQVAARTPGSLCDNPPGTIQFSSSTYSVNENGGNVTITATRTGGSYGATTVNYATANGTATGGSDYTTKSGTLSWANGDSAFKTFTVSILNDATYEGNETFTVTLSGATGATLGSPSSATVTIVDDETPPGTVQLSAATYSVNENGGTVTLTVTRTGGSSGAASVSYATSDGTATAGSDYTSKSGTLSWSDGESSSKTITVLITDDSTQEENETFTVTLSNASEAGLGSPSSATVTISANDAPWMWMVTTLAGSAGNSGSTDGTGSAAMFYRPNGVAVDSAGNVYVADNDNHTIRKVTSAGVVTTLAGSAGNSGSTDGTGSAARFCYPSGVAVDSAGNVYVADCINHTIRKVTSAGMVTTIAGSARNSGSTDGTGSAARFRYPNGVAVDSAGNVYVGDAGNYTIRKVTSAGVVTTIAGSAGNSGSTDGTGSAARFDYPCGVAVDSAGNVYVADNSGHTIRKVTSAGVVTTLAGSAGRSGSTDGTGSDARFRYPNGVAVDGAGNVYVGDTGNDTIRKVTSAGVVTTIAGSAGRSGSIDGTGSDARFNSPHGVVVDSAGNVYVGDTGNDTIRKMTPGPGTLQFNSSIYSVDEDDSSVSLTVTRSGGSSGAASVTYATANGTATAGSDYTSKSGTLSWSDGESSSKTISVSIIDDSAQEENETFTVTLSNASGAGLGTPSSATVTISANDNPVGILQFSSSTYSVNEDGGSITLTVTRSGGSSGAVSVNYATANGTATAGSDYTFTSGILSWSAGESSSKIITVSITDDSTQEENETFTVTLSNASGAGLGSPSSATVTISANDNPAGILQFSSSTYSVNENGGSVTLTVTRSGGSLGAASVQYATSDGTAIAGSDYTLKSGTLSWSDGESSSKTITVSITDDSAQEENEIFTVTLSNASGASLGSPSSATVTISANDNPAGILQFSSSTYNVSEDAGSVTLTVTRSDGSLGSASVQYATSDGTASADTDYTSVSGTLSWSDGEISSKTISVSITDDSTQEDSETFTVTLSNASGASLGLPGEAIVMINDVPVYNVIGDFDGDGKADPALMSGGKFYVWFSSMSYQCGGPYLLGGTGMPTVGDIDGDLLADPAVMDSSGNWYIWFSGSGYQPGGPYALGVSGTPVAADIDGDAKADPAVVDTAGNWYIWFSGASYQMSGPIALGVSGRPVAADFDGDSKADPAMVDTAGNWYIWFSGASYQMGGPFDLSVSGTPLAGDFDADGKADPAVVDSSSNWYIWFSASGYAQGGPYAFSVP